MSRTHSALRRLPPLLAGAGAVLAATGCSPVVEVDPAEDAANPACAPMMVVLPQFVADFPRRETSSQATAAWGDPSRVILRCGVPEPGPTTDQCVSVNGIDWVLREGEQTWSAVTYGRSPATELVFNPDEVASSTILVDLADAAAKIPQTSKCLSPDDELDAP
ncbi:hypothetical protein D477_019186 [Arthrobacter crystallopoietes BAB-32]|uniref:Secreted protein n=1 Tax=Arthrobacter crystallopoietes BAB-32 TaxID=1246476 RepID=N1UQG5_9MICC|nr:DUF3515 domain-containing protein [Arthrobacter crystallopoietes]EMY32631.1 hypothetical protein D477_019186 [Arthrobacter crystallopoietes BAB-32]